MTEVMSQNTDLNRAKPGKYADTTPLENGGGLESKIDGQDDHGMDDDASCEEPAVVCS